MAVNLRAPGWYRAALGIALAIGFSYGLTSLIRVQYVVHSFFFLFVGGLIAMLMRAELAQPGRQFVDAETFNGLFSVHASLLIFLFIIPVFAGLGNYVIPIMIGAPDMAFPRLNALSYWLLP